MRYLINLKKINKKLRLTKKKFLAVKIFQDLGNKNMNREQDKNH